MLLNEVTLNMEKENHNAATAQSSQPESRSAPAPARSAREDKAGGRGSAKRDEMIDILRNKRKAGALFRRMTREDNEATYELLGDVIQAQKDEEAAAAAEHQKKLAAAREALRHLQQQGVDQKEIALLLEEARKEVSG